ncbi:MAG: cytochrome c [Planctomycetota bacterium]
MKLSKQSLAITCAVLAAVLGGCRGGKSDKPPIHPVLDMDFQAKVKAQAAAPLLDDEQPIFADGRASRMPVEGTVAVGSLETMRMSHYFDDANGNGMPDEGEYLTDNPVEPTRANVLRGRERFEIYCSVCHTKAGGIDGSSTRGLVLQRGQLVSPTAFNYAVPDLGTEQRLRDAADGYLYKVIAHGQGTMPAYSGQIPVEDRWRIVHWLRVLQSRFE